MQEKNNLFPIFPLMMSNLEVVQETQPTLAGLAALGKAAQGAAPLLAPGILALAASVAWAATYYHPTLGARRAE